MLNLTLPSPTPQEAKETKFTLRLCGLPSPSLHCVSVPSFIEAMSYYARPKFLAALN